MTLFNILCLGALSAILISNIAHHVRASRNAKVVDAMRIRLDRIDSFPRPNLNKLLQDIEVYRQKAERASEIPPEPEKSEPPKET